MQGGGIMQQIAWMNRKETGENGLRVTRGKVFSFPTHAHMYHEMTLYEPFEGCITINQHSLSMQKSSITLMTPSDFHRIEAAEGCTARYIKVSFDESVLPPQVRTQLDTPIVLADVPLLPKLLFEELEAQCSSLTDASILLSDILLYLTRYGDRLGHQLHDSTHALALQAMRIVNERFCEAVSLRDIAGELSVSEQYLSHIFARTMGMTYSEHLTTLRLRRAAELVRETSMSVTQICFACGYRNLSHFLRSFRRKYGLSPLQMRAEKQA